MSASNNGGHAFPSGVAGPEYGDHAGWSMEPGMSLRDYFAAKVDFGSLPKFATMEVACRWVGCKVPETELEAVEFSLRLSAKLRYAQADAMLAERERTL